MIFRFHPEPALSYQNPCPFLRSEFSPLSLRPRELFAILQSPPFAHHPTSFCIDLATGDIEMRPECPCQDPLDHQCSVNPFQILWLRSFEHARLNCEMRHYLEPLWGLGCL